MQGVKEGLPLPANTSNLPLFTLPALNHRDLHKSAVRGCKPFCQREHSFSGRKQFMPLPVFPSAGYLPGGLFTVCPGLVLGWGE